MDVAAAPIVTLAGGGARRWKERAVEAVFVAAAAVSILTLIGIFVILVSSAWQAFGLREGLALSTLTDAQKAVFTAEELAAMPAEPPAPPSVVTDFLGSTHWNPVADAPLWGVASMLLSTFMVTVLAVGLSGPLGVAVAAWLAFVARPRAREVVKPVIEILAALPSVVVGFFGILVVGPAIARVFGLNSGLTALTGAVLLAVMSLPTIISLSEDALVAVPRDYVQASLALGADRWQTLVRVVIPAARSGIVAALMLGVGRAVGETMTVLMACGNAVALPHGPLQSVRTLTATIAIELGEVARGTRHFHMLFAVGLLLFLLTLAVNVVADVMVRRART